jgi:hypothetical protein
MKITESQLRQTLRQLLKEEVYGTIATVYHGSRQPPEEFLKVFENESGKVGWKIGAGSGSMYGHGLYTVWMQTGHKTFNGGYGNWIYKFKVNLNGFIIFDDAVCRKVYGSSITPLEQLERLGKKNLVKDVPGLSQFYLSSLPVKDGRSAGDAAELSKYLAGGVNGIVFFGGNDGPVVLIYDPNIVTPMAYASLEDAKRDVWKKWNPEEIKHSRARAAQAGTIADPTVLQDNSRQIVKKIKEIIYTQGSERGLEFLNNLDWLILSKIARLNALDVNVLKLLAKVKYEDIKKAIAQRTDLTDDLIQMFAKDTDDLIRSYIAKRNDLSDDLVRKLARDKSARVKKEIAGRKDLPDDLIETFARDKSAEVKKEIARFIELNENIQSILAKDPSKDVRIALAGNKYISENTKLTLAQDENHNVRMALVPLGSRGDLPNSVARLLAKDPVDTVRKYFAHAYWNMNDEIFQIMSNDEDHTVRASLAVNNNIKENTQLVLAQDQHPNVRWAVAKSWVTTEKVLKILQKDPVKKVKQAATESLEKLKNKLQEMKLKKLIQAMMF